MTQTSSLSGSSGSSNGNETGECATAAVCEAVDDAAAAKIQHQKGAAVTTDTNLADSSTVVSTVSGTSDHSSTSHAGHGAASFSALGDTSTAASNGIMAGNVAVLSAPQLIQNATIHRNQHSATAALLSQQIPAVPHNHHPQMIPALASTAILPNATTNIFQHMKLRRGKWTPEEEEYANRLIEEFENGTVTGCENGCTLRAFLSRKLHCAPMRISKKFAGKSIGKHVFLSRSTGTGLAHARSSRNHDNGVKLKELEQKFYHSLLSESNGVGDASHMHPHLMAHHAFGMFQPHAPFTPQGPHLSLTHNPFFHNFVPNSSGAMVPSFGMPNAAVNKGQSVAVATTKSTPSSTTSHEMNNSIQSTVGNNHAEQLQQTYLNAIKQAPAPEKESKSSPQQKADSNARKQKNPSRTEGDAAPNNETKTNALSSTTAIHSDQPAGSANDNATTNGASCQSSPDDGGEGEPSVVAAPQDSLGNGPTELPDLVSGFDNIAATTATAFQLQQQSLCCPPDGTSLPPAAEMMCYYSPAYTSKSFDDLHQYLGTPQPFQLNSKSVAGEANKEDTGVPVTESLKLNQKAAGATTSRDGRSSQPESNMSSEQMRGMPQPALVSLGPATNMRSGAVAQNFLVIAPSDKSNQAAQADAYAMFAQQSALAVSQHSAYCRNEPLAGEMPRRNKSTKRHRVQEPQSIAVIIDEDSTASAGAASVVNAANLKAHVEAQAQAEDYMSSSDSSGSATHRSQKRPRFSLNTKAPQAFMGASSHPSIVSGSERSNSDMGTESESALGSSQGSSTASGSESNAGSDNASDNSDSASEEGQSICREKNTSVCTGNDTRQNPRDRQRELIMSIDASGNHMPGAQ